MKLRDAERCGKAAQAVHDRIHSAIEKLTAKEDAVLRLLETLPTINEQLEGEFNKCSELLEELDPDGEITTGLPQGAPAFDVEDIRGAIESAFSDARGALELELDGYEEVVTAASEYVEPDEDEEDAEGPVSWICSHQGCGATSPEAGTAAQADAAARAAGWEIDPDYAWCPKHRDESSE